MYLPLFLPISKVRMREYPWISFSPWLNEFHTSKKTSWICEEGNSEWIKKTTEVFDLHNSWGFWHHIIYWKFSSKKIAPLMLPTPPFVAVLEHLGNDGYRNWGGELFRLLPFCSSIDFSGDAIFGWKKLATLPFAKILEHLGIMTVKELGHFYGYC